ncbi:MAG: hypothetical protein EPN86_02545 [Nanoarchaeota archaeon]|nr:MAG: hypothetical protein EPN86_02545 [Nanoarchaeota archaeon]
MDLEQIAIEADQHIPSSANYVMSLPVYEIGTNQNYPFMQWYSLRFLRPVTIDTGKGLGWPEGLGGLNYVGTGKRFARSDWVHQDADYVITHEIKHDAPLFHGHDLAEYWNRLTDPVDFRPGKPIKEHQPHYLQAYSN